MFAVAVFAFAYCVCILIFRFAFVVSFLNWFEFISRVEIKLIEFIIET